MKVQYRTLKKFKNMIDGIEVRSCSAEITEKDNAK